MNWDEPFPWDRPTAIRTARLPHSHITQVKVPLRGDCEACDQIDPFNMKRHPYELGYRE